MKYKNLHEIARNVVEHLPGFEYVDDARQKNADGEYYYAAQLTSVTETRVEHPIATVCGVSWYDRSMELILSGSSVQRNKLKISLHAPHVMIGSSLEWTGDTLRQGEKPASILVSPDRVPRAIAADVTRRLVSNAIAQWVNVLSWVADREARQEAQNDVIEQMRAMDVSFSTHDLSRGSITIGEVSAYLTVSGSSVRFERLTVTAAQACAIFQALKQRWI